MIKLPSVLLPPEFSKLLQFNLHQFDKMDGLDSIYDKIDLSIHTKIIIEKFFQHITGKRGVHNFLRYLGWINFRDRFGSVYLYFMLYDRYPEVTDTELVKDILDLENKLAKYSVDGHSRSFLLFYYLKMASIHILKNKIFDQEQSETEKISEQITESFIIPDEIYQLLDYSEIKTWYIDWVVLILWHFNSYLGKDKMRELLFKKDSTDSKESKDFGGDKIKFNYQNFYSILTGDQKKEFASNMLAYGHSIGVKDIFFEHLRV
ncbi:MAG: hypothetical protein HQK51_04530 [Oligoflexia bacterium]|nr:hypothetical protein [Oligoflexia bacterium]